MKGESIKPKPSNIYESLEIKEIYGKEFLGSMILSEKHQIKLGGKTPLSSLIEEIKILDKPNKSIILSEDKAETPILDIGAQQTITADTYQKKVLADAIEDSTITDYSVAYKRLVQERNKPWKINPSDIADFYLLARYIGEHEGSKTYREDSTYLAVAKAKDRVSDIGRHLLVALAHEQLDEYDRFATVRPDAVSDELRTTIRDHYKERSAQTQNQETDEAPQSIEQEINTYLADFNAMIEQHATRGEIRDIFTNQATNAMFGNALKILESQQRGRWQVMAKAMRALHDNSIPMSKLMQSLTATDGVKITAEMEETLERQRTPFLIDRLLNYVHNTGTMSARVTNYFPRAASLLLAHGISGHDDYLLYHSRLGYGSDTLAKGVQQYATRGEGNDFLQIWLQQCKPKKCLENINMP